MSTAPDESGWRRLARERRPSGSLEEHLDRCRMFFDGYASVAEHWQGKNRGYHDAIESLTTFCIPPGKRVLEVGCGPGDLLAATRPSLGVGIDASPRMVALARRRHASLQFHEMSAESLDLEGQAFDYVILSDLVGFLYDIALVFERLHRVCNRHTRIVINWYSRVWQPILALAEATGHKHPEPLLNWTTPADIANLLHLSGFEVVRARGHILLPLRIPGLAHLMNRIVANLPFFRLFTLANLTVARSVRAGAQGPVRVSVVCPCRNEAGNIAHIVRRLPALGSHTELIFVEGGSSDDTLEECHRAQAAHPEKDITVLTQAGRGKGDAVRLGFARSSGDMLMILDADLSVAPEDLVQFYSAMASGKGDFINGSRLVYAMDAKAMRFLNLLGNRFFAWLLSTLIGQRLKDSLCGTKVIWRQSYDDLAAGRSYFGEFDPYGDFDLLFGAAKLNLRIAEIPIRYRERTYGQTNISRFSGGFLLLRMSAVAAAKLYFVS